MEIKIIAFKINFLKNVGEISDQKIKMFVDEFNKELPDKNEIPGGVILSKTANNLVKSLLITPTQIVYSEDGENIDLDFNNPKTMIKEICDKLYLNYKCGAVYSFSCLIDGGEHSNVLNNKLNLGLDTEDVKGVGIKVFLDNDIYGGVFSFEPYLRSLDKYFCSLELQLKNQLNIKEIVDYGKNESLQLFEEMVEKIYNNL